jgi:hypothetical protein
LFHTASKKLAIQSVWPAFFVVSRIKEELFFSVRLPELPTTDPFIEPSEVRSKGIMGRWMINCEEYSKLVSVCMDRPATIWERLLIKIHQLICPPCGYMRKQFDDIRTACRWVPADQVDSSSDERSLPDAARDRIKSAIKDLSA